MGNLILQDAESYTPYQYCITLRFMVKRSSAERWTLHFVVRSLIAALAFELATSTSNATAVLSLCRAELFKFAQSRSNDAFMLSQLMLQQPRDYWFL